MEDDQSYGEENDESYREEDATEDAQHQIADAVARAGMGNDCTVLGLEGVWEGTGPCQPEIEVGWEHLHSRLVSHFIQEWRAKNIKWPKNKNPVIIN